MRIPAEKLQNKKKHFWAQWTFSPDDSFRLRKNFPAWKITHVLAALLRGKPFKGTLRLRVGFGCLRYMVMASIRPSFQLPKCTAVSVFFPGIIYTGTVYIFFPGIIYTGIYQSKVGSPNRIL